MSLPSPQTRPRRTQEERSAETRERLLDATVESLIESGYSGTTTTAVCERAGLSRGAQLHHFPTKAALVISALTHLAQRRAIQIPEDAGFLEADDRLGRALDFLWDSFEGPLFYAALELWVAARTDPELHENLYAVERQIGRAMALRFRPLVDGDSEADKRVDDAVELTFYVLRGMALQRILRDDDTERRRLFELWKRMVSDFLSDETPSKEKSK